MDFYKIVERSRKGEIEIYPDFRVAHVTDLLVRGKDFYAVWDESKGLWSTDILDVQRMVDADLWQYANRLREERHYDGYLNVKTLESDSTGSWQRFTQYLKRYPDSGVRLDESLTFANTKVKKTDYISRRLPYALEAGDYSAWDRLVGQLYSPKEREKIEWAIGAVVSGDSKTIQKFCVFYGEPGTGKGTIIDIIQKLFDGYYATFEAKALGSANNQFATEVFRTNPLVAIQHDGDLSRIEDNTKLNSIISHEVMVINEKNKPQYMGKANCFLFLGTNRPVKITDAKSGIIRRLIDITPTGNTFSPKEYDTLMSQIEFQLGATAYHCLEVYRSLGKNYYKSYTPKEMIMKTDVFYNFVEACQDALTEEDGISLKQAYTIYKNYCDEALVEFKLPRHKFREELKNYFERFDDISRIDGKQVRSWYSGFRHEKFDPPVIKQEEHSLPMVLDQTKSLLDDILANCPAQYANEKEAPERRWAEVTTTLKDLDTTRLHYILPKLVGEKRHLIMIDFDIRNEKGEKDALLNMEAASKWPPTYAEYSKGGAGIHLIYWYEGDISQLAVLYADGIEVKAFRGNSAMRRRLSRCNSTPIATLEIGALPVKEEKVIDLNAIKDNDHLRNIIKKCLRKENHGATRPEIDLIAKVLDDAEKSGMTYDVTNLGPDIRSFARHSTNQSEYCIKVVNGLKLKSDDPIEELVKKDDPSGKEEPPIIFFDCEVFPNLLVVNWKLEGPENAVVRMINPTGREIEKLFGYRMVGFNCRKYDNHILWGRYLGLDNQALFDLSQAIIVEKGPDAFYSEAYNLSYTDIYDFCSKKQSLKKWEIELGIHHQELGLPWDKPVPEDRWKEVAEYCDNDVIATEAVWNARQADFTARKILADIAGGSVNDTTNQLSTKFIFGTNRNPQNEFNYRDMGDVSKVSHIYDDRIKELGCDPEYTLFDANGMPIFPGYKFEFNKSTYRGEEVGEGGYVYSEPGIHFGIPTQDVSGMHPSSAIDENLFGDRYTKRFSEIVQTRIFIKHKDFDNARKMLDGKLEKYLTDESQAKGLAGALKIVVNSVYGLTSARFANPFRDPRNKDNIVAKRGALFMINLKHEVQRRGYTVVHIKTDSIKVERADDKIVQFIRDYGKLYGYSFETEAEYDRLCLVNDAVYIAHEKNEGWTATGAQFQQPYVFKTLFSGEPIEFSDLCETKTVTGGAIYLDMNERLQPQEEAETEAEKRAYNKAHPDKPKKLSRDFDGVSDEELRDIIASAHDYHFVGRAGLFFPVKSGRGGGVMLREKDGKYYAVTGTKGYRWLEAESVEKLHMEDSLDPKYHDELVTEAIKAIEKFGSFEDFIDLSKPYEDRRQSKRDTVPWERVPCGDGKRSSCMECPAFENCDYIKK